MWGTVMRNIDFIRAVTAEASDNWPHVLAGLHIDVPDSPRKHAPCPACGGTDRFRFDDNGRGSFICNQCGAGDGLDLIKRVNNCDTTEAAQLAAGVLGIDYRAAEADQKAGSQSREQAETERQHREQERQLQAAEDTAQRREVFARLYDETRQKAAPGESQYLIAKGLNGFSFPILPNGSLLLPLVDDSGAVVAGQTITAQGVKRLLKGSAKRGAFHAINAAEQPETVVIGEGLATAMPCHLISPDALVVAAIDAGNLPHVAKVMRRKYPQAQIVIAADNDWHDDEPNTGELAAIKAAQAVSGWVTMPPGDHKADWNDYHQQNGLEAATAAFNDLMYQPQGEDVKPQLQAIEGGKSRRKSEAGDISQMAASQKAKLLSGRWDMLAVNPDSGGVYCYGAGVWEKLADSELERVMVSIFEEHEAHYTEKGIKSVVATMKLQLPVIGEQRGDLIGFENGV